MSIPNRAMFYWRGGCLSWMRYNTLWSFRKLHPDWEMTLFYGGPAPGNPNQRWEDTQDWLGSPDLGHDYLPEVAALGVEIKAWRPPAGYPNSEPSHENDICRWGALSQFGGWFFDLDILFVDKMEKLEVDDRADVAFIPARDWIPTGFMGAVKGNQFTAAMYDCALSAPDKTRYRACGAEAIARAINLPAAAAGWGQHTRTELTRNMRAAFPGISWQFISQAACYRWEWFDAAQIFSGDGGVLSSTIAIHWYGNQRVAQRAQRKLTAENYSAHAMPYTEYAKNLAEADLIV